VASLSTDSILAQSKARLSTDQAIRVSELENSISRGDVRNQQLQVYHQLAHFWSDTARIFEPYAWYEGESARLENSEKSLTFAAHLFLDNLRAEDNPALRTWKALQAKDLFERSLKINPRNDSSQVGLGACYIFGNISETPMEGILKIREVVERDSTNAYAQMMLGNASMLSGQYDKAIIRFETVLRLQPANLEAMLILAEAYERKDEKQPAIQWYQKSLPLIKMDEVRKEVENRINELKK
jgi:cytochrome c-type biogenesis protein CcmH/NrfG